MSGSAHAGQAPDVGDRSLRVCTGVRARLAPRQGWPRRPRRGSGNCAWDLLRPRQTRAAKPSSQLCARARAMRGPGACTPCATCAPRGSRTPYDDMRGAHGAPWPPCPIADAAVRGHSLVARGCAAGRGPGAGAAVCQADGIFPRRGARTVEFHFAASLLSLVPMNDQNQTTRATHQSTTSSSG